MNVEEMKIRLIQDIETLKSSRGYLNAGYPRYNTLFGRDSLITAWQMLEIDPSIARVTLQTLTDYQGKTLNQRTAEEPGKIIHEHQFDFSTFIWGKIMDVFGWIRRYNLPAFSWIKRYDFPYYGSVDSTPLFIILGDKYFRRTGDRKFLLEIWDMIIAAFGWIKHYGDKDGDGYVEYEGTPYGLFHQGWKDGFIDHLKIKPPVAIVEAQGYVYAAYQSLIFLAKKLGKKGISREALTRSKVLKDRFNEDFWMVKENYFALALDGENRQRRAVTSNPGHLLFTGIVAQNRIKSLISRLFQPDFWTPYGIRNHSSEDSDFNPYSYHVGSVWPHDNWIIYKGLQNLGFDWHANQIKKALIRAYMQLGKIPELYTVINDNIIDLSAYTIKGTSSNPLQAWASAGLLEMIWND